MKTSDKIEKALKELATKGQIIHRTENNPYLKVSYKGSGNPISDKWNIKIYNSGKIVTNDTFLLKQIVNGTICAPNKNLKIIKIDDAGIGFPLGGIMIGVDDGTNLWVDIVDVTYFQGELYKSKKYLEIYTEKGIRILKKIGVNPKEHCIEICSGYINKRLKTKLRSYGFNVTITNITGLLQEGLEKEYRDYIKRETNKDLYYDPKEILDVQIGHYYTNALKWGIKNAPNFIKSGWSSIKIKN